MFVTHDVDVWLLNDKLTPMAYLPLL